MLMEMVNSMESEIAEVVVFLKAGGDPCQLFEDISIHGDEAVPCHGKCCVANCELDHNNISSFLKHELDDPSDVSEELMLYISTTGVQESFPNHHRLKDDAKLCGAQNKLMMEAKADFGGRDDIHRQSVDDGGGGITKLSLFQLFNSGMDDVGKEEQSIQDNVVIEGDNNLSISADDWRLEMDYSGQHERLEKEEERSTETSGVENSGPDSAYTSSQRDIGSASFSAASTPSGRIQSCDNMSLRSNSTTSTTSFAFPILATEWNESPIRMAEVDRRRRRSTQKSTCWAMCFTCSNSMNE